jgi:predicted PurR-regulated permease PerM
VVPEMTEAVNTIISKAPGQFMRFQEWIEPYYQYVPILEDWINVNLSDVDWQDMAQRGLQFLSTGAGSLFNSTVGIISNVALRILSILIGLVFAIYVLFEQENLKRQSKKIVYSFFNEPKADEIVHIMRVSNQAFSNFISGQVLEALILGTMFWITLSILQFPYALLIGVLISVTALIPIIGAFIGCVIGALLILVLDPMLAVWFLLVFIILQQIEGNLIYPFVVGNKIGIPSMWVLMAVTIGGSLMGITGILIFIPLFSIIYTLLKEKSNKRLNEKNIHQKKWTE